MNNESTKTDATSSNISSHVCVLCSTTLSSKEELQDHFRRHANKEIDYRGQPINKRFVLKKEVEKPAATKIIKVVQAPAVKSSTIYGTKLKNVKVVEAKKSVVVKAANLEIPSVPVLPPVKSTSVECDVCRQPFDTITLAIQHKFRKHPNSSLKYFCPFCGMQFPLKYNRDTHLEKNHKGEEEKGSFTCEDCKVVFSTSEAHTYHIKSTHKRIVAIFKPIVTPPPSKKIKVNNANEAQSVYYCHLCGYEYIVKFNLQKHLERQHTDVERDGIPSSLMKCTTCDALFYNKKAYDNHNMYHRPDDLYVTSEEQRLQTVSRVDQDFDIRRVIQPVDKYMAKVRANIGMKRKFRDAKAQPTLSSLSDSELSPASSPPTSDSEDDSAEKNVPVIPVQEKVVVKEIKKPVEKVEKKKAKSPTPPPPPPAPKRAKRKSTPPPPVRRNSVRAARKIKS